MTYKKYDANEAQQKTEEKRSEMHTLLQNGAKALLEEIHAGKSERLLALFSYSSRFYRYSPNNQLLILLQCLTRGISAQYVASFTTWKRMHYQVRKGERGIAIYVPRPYSRVDETSAQEMTRTFFKVSYVFANTQVEPMNEEVSPLPAFFVPLEGECDALYERLAEVVLRDGIQLVEQDYAGAQGFSTKGRIGIKPGLDSTSGFLTLIHEYAHELLHKGTTLEKQVKECQAEATSYIVAHHFGVKNPYSSDYIQMWGNDEKSLLNELEVVQRIAAFIIERMEQPFLPGMTASEAA